MLLGRLRCRGGMPSTPAPQVSLAVGCEVWCGAWVWSGQPVLSDTMPDAMPDAMPVLPACLHDHRLWLSSNNTTAHCTCALQVALGCSLRVSRLTFPMPLGGPYSSKRR